MQEDRRAQQDHGHAGADVKNLGSADDEARAVAGPEGQPGDIAATENLAGVTSGLISPDDLAEFAQQLPTVIAAEADRLAPAKAHELDALRTIIPVELEGALRSRLKEAGLDVETAMRELDQRIGDLAQTQTDWTDLRKWATQYNPITEGVLVEQELSPKAISSRFVSEMSSSLVADGSLQAIAGSLSSGTLFTTQTEPFGASDPPEGPQPVVPTVGPQPVVPTVGRQPVGAQPVAPVTPVVPSTQRFVAPYLLDFSRDSARIGGLPDQRLVNRAAGTILVENLVGVVDSRVLEGSVGSAFTVPAGTRELRVNASVSCDWAAFAGGAGYASAEAILRLDLRLFPRAAGAVVPAGRQRRSLGHAISALLWATVLNGRGEQHLSVSIAAPAVGGWSANVAAECWAGSAALGVARSSCAVSIHWIEVQLLS